MDLKGKVAVVSGASSGLGAMVAKKLAQQSVKLVLVAHEQIKLESVAVELGGMTKVVAIPLDLTSDNAANEVRDEALKAFGSVDILISNAGIWTDNELEIQNPERIKLAFETNSIAAIYLNKAFLPHFTKKDAGHIVNVISSAGASDTESGNNEDWMTYGATKWALTGFTNALTRKLKPSGIRVTAFMPGGFESDLYESAGRAGGNDGLHSQPWMMETADVADALIFCLTRPSDVQVEKMLITKK